MVTTSLRRLIPVAVAVGLAGAAASRAQSCPTRPSWPTADWPPIASTDPSFATTHATQIAALEDALFTLTGQDSERLGIRTDSVIIIRGGVILYERYARGWTDDKPHRTWSVSKSVTSALVGLAVQRGVLSLDDPLSAHVAIDNPDPRVGGITVRQLLEYSSGLDWSETYELDVYQTSSVLAMLYGLGRRDGVKFVASHELRDTPGTTWAYSSGDSTLLAAAVSGSMSATYGDEFPHTELFDPIGMNAVVFERDPANNIMGATSWYATPRDMARFGYLYLNDGCWNGTRYLPPGWVTSSSQVAQVLKTGGVAVPDTLGTGWHFWLNQAIPEQSLPLPWADVPNDTYLAWGHWGQYIIIIPSQDVVIVRTGDDRNQSVDMNQFIKLALAVAQ